MAIFSKRYSRALEQKKLAVKLPPRLRRRLWTLMEGYNVRWAYQPDPTDDWVEDTSLLIELESALLSEYGEKFLRGFKENGDLEPCDLETFVEHGPPWEVLDAVEYYSMHVGDSGRVGVERTFHQEVNRIMSEEAAPWNLSGGQFFQVATEFIAVQLQAAENLLHARGFPGALAELREARNDLTAGDYKGAIHEASKAYESALKTLLGTESGTASTLTRKLRDEGFIDDVPESTCAGIVEQTLMCLPTLRNRLGGHGQGETVVEVPRRYAVLAVSLAAAFVSFCVDLETDGPQTAIPAPSP